MVQSPGGGWHEGPPVNRTVGAGRGLRRVEEQGSALLHELAIPSNHEHRTM